MKYCYVSGCTTSPHPLKYEVKNHGNNDKGVKRGSPLNTAATPHMIPVWRCFTLQPVGG